MPNASQQRHHYSVKGRALPDDEALDRFWGAAKATLPAAALPGDYQLRWIGGNESSTFNILQHFRSGDKTGSVTLADVVENIGQANPEVGDATVLTNFDGTPALFLRTVKLELVAYGDIGEQHTRLDGPRVRELTVWKELHEPYFNMLLAPYGLNCVDQTRVWFETFEVVYST